LTSHGWTQATRLGRHFCATGVVFTHIFSSTLQRAYKTAELVRAAQDGDVSTSSKDAQLTVSRLDLLKEQDFGSYEGVSFRESIPTRNGPVPQDHAGSSKQGLKPIVLPETAASMEARMDEFLNQYIMPLLAARGENGSSIVAIVSHGIILGVLWRRLLRRLPPKRISVHPHASGGRPVSSIEHLGGWSNTGYLELDLAMCSISVQSPTNSKPRGDTPFLLEHTNSELPNLAQSMSVLHPAVPLASDKTLQDWFITVQTINGVRHLQGLKRTRGGIGSAKHDEGQQSIESFFKRKKLN
jgi:broad specificity phosphatase PhoE